MNGKVMIGVAIVCVGGLLAVCAGGAFYAAQAVRSETLLEQAADAAREQRYDLAADLYAEALELSDDDADAWAEFAWALFEIDRDDEAVQACDRALALQRNLSSATYTRAYALDALDRNAEAAEGFARTAELGFRPVEALSRRAALLIDLERMEEADAALSSALQRRSDDADWWNTLGNQLHARGRHVDAITAYENALDLDPDHKHARFNRALALSGAERYAEAIADLDASIERKHRVAEAYLERGRARDKLGDSEAALADLRKACRSDGGSAEAWAETGDILVRQGKDEEALTAYGKAIEARPEYDGVLREMGEILRRQGKTDEALAAFDLSIEYGESPHDALVERGRLRMDDLDDDEAAAADFDRAVEVDPSYVHAYTNRGWLRESQKDWSRAFDDYSAALQITPDDVWALGARGRMHDKLDRPEDAFDDFERAIRLDPVAGASLVHDWRRASERSRDGTEGGPDLRLVQGELTALRQRPFLRDVPSETQAPESFGERVSASIEGSSTAEQRDGQKVGLRRLGLMRTPAAGAEDVDLKEALVHALETQAAAYYDPERDTFIYVAEGMPADMVETVAAHELVHALQDQHKDLSEFLRRASRRPRGAPRNDDRVLAYRSVAEGEATFVQFAWQAMRAQWIDPEDALAMNTMVVGMVSGMDTRRLLDLSAKMMENLPDDHPVKRSLAQADRIPPYILEPFLGAYFKGAGLCNYQYSKHGWEGIDALYDRPPESSEQVLHPLRYEKRRDRPTEVTLPDLGIVEAAGWTRCDAAVHGELYLTLLLAESGTKRLAARKATAGWDGDVYAAYRIEDRAAIVLLTAWDSEDDAEQFADAYRRVLLRRAGAPEDSVLATRSVGDGVASLIESSAPDDQAAVLVRGRDVLVADGWPAALLPRVLERLERHAIDHVD